MLPEDVAWRLQHMLEAADEIINFTAGKSFDDLLSDRGLQHICLHSLQIIGEAATKIDGGFRDEHSEIPWRPIISMRNRLIHGYFDVELSFIWHAVTEDIPDLISHLRALLANNG